MSLRWLPWLLVLAGCPVAPLPGDQPMGVYSMTATQPERAACGLEEVTGTELAFEATLSRESTSERAWVTLAGYSREATFDGQVLTSNTAASRVFSACGDCQTRIVERITVAVLSRSQTDLLGAECPLDVLDGGIPRGTDGGVTLPKQTERGFDAVRLCGELTTEVVSDGLADGGACPAACSGCQVHYQLRGDRR